MAFTALVGDDDEQITWTLSYGKLSENQWLLRHFGIIGNAPMFQFCIVIQRHKTNIDLDELDRPGLPLRELDNDDLLNEDYISYFDIDTLFTDNVQPCLYYLVRDLPELRSYLHVCRVFIANNPHVPEQYIIHPKYKDVILSKPMSVWLTSLMAQRN